MSLATLHIIKELSLWIWCLLQSHTSSKNQALGFDVSCSLACHQRTKPEGLTSLGTLHIIKEPSLGVWCPLQSRTSSKNQAWRFDVSWNLTHYQRTKPEGLMSLGIWHVIKEPSLRGWCLLQPYTLSKNQARGFGVSLLQSQVWSHLRSKANAFDTFTYYKHKMCPVFQEGKQKESQNSLKLVCSKVEEKKKRRFFFFFKILYIHATHLHHICNHC